MKLQELFLIETTEEDRALISLADIIARHVRKYADFLDPDSTEPVDVGVISDFADTPIDLGDIHILLQDGESLGKDVAKSRNEEYNGEDIGGVWDNAIPGIIINADRLYSERVKSIIVHELRHALDDLKSEGRASSSKKYRTPKKKIHRKQDPHTKDYPYLAEPMEINGRFAQIQNALIDSIAKNADLPETELFNKEMELLKRLFKNYTISELFTEKERSPDYKRLVKRAVDMIQKEIKYIKSIG